MTQINLTEMGIICALGAGKKSCSEGLRTNTQQNLQTFELNKEADSDSGTTIAAKIPDQWLNPLFGEKKYTRNNRILLTAAEQIKTNIEELKTRYPKDRIGIVLGTSTSGILEGEQAVESRSLNGDFPPEFHYSIQEMGDPALCLASYFELSGPAFCISTACSSSGKAFISARRLIESGFCDAVICGGADSLCQLTVQGFSSLEATSNAITNPFSKNRDGINIGEGACLFICEAHQHGDAFISLAGVGESSDAHHISAPHPEGEGAKLAMQAALDDASLDNTQIDYLNCHGTGTHHNDLMESKAIGSILSPHTLCSSTKPLTGHTLGAAGAIEAGICYLLLSNAATAKPHIPPMLWDQEHDTELEQVNFVSDASQPKQLTHCMSNSFAFGGSNVSIILRSNQKLNGKNENR